ncbi:ATP-binding cassette subfamily C protein LapB [Roseibium hamelinense]|uniref:ATP-binding cassette subfamily C protein LapB n=1 Tax=Roseibium hamelinense TaxID=150831 RepID=A0A562SLG9_9HYPH|nr:ABC transporter transmembrane domain-containing protein [Roseibium hamelinense]MTI42246.1 ATP-binding cassette domain-containing protein [Roseibium hamelinense]TWI82141.1 ATP-binding cassette subfamily C protein LapB [Roseibium hamelinense]
MVSFIRDTLSSLSLPELSFKSSTSGKTIKPPRLPGTVIAASVLINVLALAMPLTILQVYDRILPNNATDTLIVLVIGLAVVLLFDAILKILRLSIVSWLASSFTHLAQLEAVRRILYRRSDIDDDATVSKQIDSLRALQSLGDHYGGQARLLPIDIPASMIFLVVLFLIGGPIALVPIVLLGVFALLTARLNTRLTSLVEKRSQQDQRKYDFIIEVLTGLSTIKSLGLEPIILRRYERLQKQVAQQGYDYIELSNKARNLTSLFTILTTVGVVSVGALLAMGGIISVGTVAACTLLAGQVVQPLLRGINHWTDMQRIGHDFADARSLFNLPQAQPLQARHTSLTGNIELTGVSFTHHRGSMVSIHDVSLRIKAGQSVAIAGSDGSGRSTISRLMAGDLRPTSGRILLDGEDLFGPAHEPLRSQIAYVGNDAQMFAGTILQNLTLFGSQTDVRKARMAASLIGLEKDIHLLPLGYDTMLSTGIEENLTASMIQRIAIARALAGEPKFLILDDANVPLDHASEAQLVEGLKRIKGQLTLIVVSHRPSFRALADIEYTMRDGTLTGTGHRPSGPKATARPAIQPRVTRKAS